MCGESCYDCIAIYNSALTLVVSRFHTLFPLTPSRFTCLFLHSLSIGETSGKERESERAREPRAKSERTLNSSARFTPLREKRAREG